jgi:hypothetical protein
MRAFSKIFSFLTVVGAIGAVLVIYFGVQEARSVMQETGMIAFGLALTIVPYCMSKALKDLSEPEDVRDFYMPEKRVMPTLQEVIDKPRTAFMNPNGVANAMSAEQAEQKVLARMGLDKKEEAIQY